MPVIVMAAPKGGVGKTTCAILLATEFARNGAEVVLIDCDMNKSLTSWAELGTLPKGISIQSDPTQSDLVKRIRAADQADKLVIVDTEGVASLMVSRAITQADLVLIPMTASTIEARKGAEAVHQVYVEREAMDRDIPFAVVMTRTSAVPTSTQREVIQSLTAASVPIVGTHLLLRKAYEQLFALGGDPYDMRDAGASVGNIDAAIDNAQSFAASVLQHLSQDVPA